MKRKIYNQLLDWKNNRKIHHIANGYTHFGLSHG